jgi:hypothetical protein
MSDCGCTLDITVQAPVVLDIAVAAPVVVDVAVAGVQGPPSTGGIDYTQASPAAVWTIAHNLGFRPAVATFTPGGLAMLGSVLHLSDDVLQITFTQPTVGFARLN